MTKLKCIVLHDGAQRRPHAHDVLLREGVPNHVMVVAKKGTEGQLIDPDTLCPGIGEPDPTRLAQQIPSDAVTVALCYAA